MDIYFDENYGKLYEDIEKGVMECFKFNCFYGEIKHMFIKREIPVKVNNEIYYDLITPYGYGGPIVINVIGDNKEKLIDSFEKEFTLYCKKNNIVSEFVRFHPITKNYDDFEKMYDAKVIRNTVGTDLTGDNILEREFSKHCRKRIKKAMNAGISYRVIEKPDNIRSFKEIYYSTMDRNGADDYYYFDDEYFNHCLQYFRNNIILVEAIYEEKVIAAGFYFIWDDIIHIHLSGTLTEYLHLSPAYILRYAVTEWGIANGYKLIHHGGGRSNSIDDGLYKFKKQFGKNLDFKFSIGKKIWNEDIYRALCEQTNNKKGDFFPLYRVERKDILILAHFTQDPTEDGNGRFHYIANLLCNDYKNDVEIVTTSYSHRNKAQRELSKNDLDRVEYKFTMIYEPGYKKNVSLKRFSSHYVMAKNLKKYLDCRKKPDIIYCSIPSIDVAYVGAKYAKENKIKFIVDIQDIWPEAFRMIFNVPILSDLIFKPMEKKADYVYAQANEIVAVSETYAKRGLRANSVINKAHSVFLGTDLQNFDCLPKNEKVGNEIILVYIGTLGHSYDLTTIFDAINRLNNHHYTVKFLIMGDGPLRDKFENQAKSKKINAEFTGSLPYDEMIKRLCGCDIAINPIAHGAAQSIINKVGDYAAAGLPVISTQECKEYVELLSKSNSGISCVNGNVDDITKQIKYLIDNENVRNEMAKNSRKVAEQYFDRNKTYKEIIDLF